MFNLNIYKNKVAIFFVVVLFFWIVYKSYLFTNRADGYILGDWLINYEDGGFKRRGLSGSFFFFLQDISGLPLQRLVWFFQVILYSVFFYFVVKIINKIQSIDLIFLFTPVTFLFWFYNSYAIGRKEILLFVVLILYANDILSGRKNYLINGILLGISVLFHELSFFYIPYFVFIYFFIERRSLSLDLFKLLVFSFISIICLYLFSDFEIFRGNTLQLLQKRGVILDDVSLFTQTYQFNISQASFDFRTWSYLFVIVLNLLFIYLRYKDKKVFLFVCLCWIPSVFLFMNGSDWGRWIFIHFLINAMMLILFSLKNKSTLTKYNRIGLCIYLLISLLYKMEFQEMGLMINPVFSKIVNIFK